MIIIIIIVIIIRQTQVLLLLSSLLLLLLLLLLLWFQVGCTYLHTSRNLALFRGVFFCMRCGGWCTEKPVILARACVGNASAAGRLALRKLEKRLLPGRVWPNGH